VRREIGTEGGYPGGASYGAGGKGLSVPDGAAAALSSLCLLHCLLLPLAFALSPVIFGITEEALHGPAWLHWALILVAAPASIYALAAGAAAHGARAPWRLAVLGFAAVAAGAAAHGLGPIEQGLTLVGGLLVALAHWLNWRARRCRG
jgi:hypothetical protein